MYFLKILVISTHMVFSGPAPDNSFTPLDHHNNHNNHASFEDAFNFPQNDFDLNR